LARGVNEALTMPILTGRGEWRCMVTGLFALPGAGFMQLSGVRLSVRLSHPAAARRCCGFAAVGPAARRYRSIAARPAVSSSRAAARHTAANAGSATLSADVRR